MILRMSKFILYLDTLSQPCRAVNLFLLANNVPFETKIVNLAKGEQLSKEFSEINPFQKVPVLEHNGFVLTESVAILRYLCREINVADHWYPKDSINQAKVDEYMEWQHANTRYNCAMYFQEKYLKPLLLGKPSNEKLVKMYFDGMEKTCDNLVTVWLKNKSFLCGNEISVADLLGACELEQPRMAGYDPRDGRPVLRDWLDRVRSMLQPHYDTVHGRLNKVCSKYGGKPLVVESKL